MEASHSAVIQGCLLLVGLEHNPLRSEMDRLLEVDGESANLLELPLPLIGNLRAKHGEK